MLIAVLLVGALARDCPEVGGFFGYQAKVSQGGGASCVGGPNREWNFTLSLCGPTNQSNHCAVGRPSVTPLWGCKTFSPHVGGAAKTTAVVMAAGNRKPDYFASPGRWTVTPMASNAGLEFVATGGDQANSGCFHSMRVLVACDPDGLGGITDLRLTEHAACPEPFTFTAKSIGACPVPAPSPRGKLTVAVSDGCPDVRDYEGYQSLVSFRGGAVATANGGGYALNLCGPLTLPNNCTVARPDATPLWGCVGGRRAFVLAAGNNGIVGSWKVFPDRRGLRFTATGGDVVSGECRNMMMATVSCDPNGPGGITDLKYSGTSPCEKPDARHRFNAKSIGACPALVRMPLASPAVTGPACPDVDGFPGYQEKISKGGGANVTLPYKSTRAHMALRYNATQFALNLCGPLTRPNACTETNPHATLLWGCKSYREFLDQYFADNAGAEIMDDTNSVLVGRVIAAAHNTVGERRVAGEWSVAPLANYTGLVFTATGGDGSDRVQLGGPECFSSMRVYVECDRSGPGGLTDLRFLLDEDCQRGSLTSYTFAARSVGACPAFTPGTRQVLTRTPGPEIDVLPTRMPAFGSRFLAAAATGAVAVAIYALRHRRGLTFEQDPEGASDNETDGCDRRTCLRRRSAGQSSAKAARMTV